MTDKTPGAYQRHEKHEAADFANAEFARHPEPAIANAARNTMTGVWRLSNGLTTDSEYLARGGWSPVRECPDPDEHHGPDWKAISEKTARDFREAARNTTRQRERAEKAEKERDEALYQRDQWMRGNDSTHDILDEAIMERRQIARALDLPENATADEMVKRAAVSRPLTPDAITDEMVERAHAAAAGFGTAADISASATFAMLTAALTEPPARPEGAEELEADIGRDGEDAPFDLTPEHVTALADHLAALGWTKERS